MARTTSGTRNTGREVKYRAKSIVNKFLDIQYPDYPLHHAFWASPLIHLKRSLELSSLEEVKPRRPGVQLRGRLSALHAQNPTFDPTEERRKGGKKRRREGRRNGWAWWYTPALSALWEAEAGRLQVQAQPAQPRDLARPCV